MPMSRTTLLAGVAAIGIVAGLGTLSLAQQQPTTSGDVLGELANNEGIFVDGKTFKIARGKAKGEPSAQIAKLGAKEVGPGAIVFRHADKLYMVEGTPEPAPQAMKDFQDNWSTSYMKAMKEFQDNFNVSYMKNQNASYMKDQNASYMKDQNASYMNAVKEFQDQWNVSYAKAFKEFQDNWNTSYMKNQNASYMKDQNASYMKEQNALYMKAVKDFQDNWSTSYMK
jgi:predicted aconitase with swiveling domain